MGALVVKEYRDPPSHWDPRICSAGLEASFLQTTLWGDLVRLLDKATPLFLEVWDGELLTASLMLLHRVPYNRGSGRIQRDLKSVLLGRSGGWLEFSGGPTFYVCNRAVESLTLLLKWVSGYAQTHKLHRIHAGGFATTSCYGDDSRISETFRSFGYCQNLWATYLVDLTVDESTLWLNTSRAARKAVNKAKRHNITVDSIHTWDDYVSRFHAAYLRCHELRKQEATPLDAMKQAWKHSSHAHYRYLIAMDPRGRILATLGMFDFGGVATEIMSVLAEEAYNEKIPAQDALHWQMLLAAKNMGFTVFDLAGVNPSPETPKELGIRRFKEKWGGRYVAYNRYVRENKPFVKRVIFALQEKLRDNK